MACQEAGHRGDDVADRAWPAVEWRSRRDGGEVAIGLSDDGTGIAADDVPHLFDRFYRCRSGGGGAGAGSAIAASRTRTMAGRITAVSTSDNEVTLTVRLPARDPPAEPRR